MDLGLFEDGWKERPRGPALQDLWSVKRNVQNAVREVYVHVIWLSALGLEGVGRSMGGSETMAEVQWSQGRAPRIGIIQARRLNGDEGGRGRVYGGMGIGFVRVYGGIRGVCEEDWIYGDGWMCG